MTKECRECHHIPSDRTAEYGATCCCKCHAVADASPELLEALEAARVVMSTEGENDIEEWRDTLAKVEAALALARGE